MNGERRAQQRGRCCRTRVCGDVGWVAWVLLWIVVFVRVIRLARFVIWDLQKADALLDLLLWCLAQVFILFYYSPWGRSGVRRGMSASWSRSPCPNMSSQMPSRYPGDGDIDLDPDYQRGPFFLINPLSLTPQSHCLARGNSIFCNFYIPPVIFCNLIICNLWLWYECVMVCLRGVWWVLVIRQNGYDWRNPAYHTHSSLLSSQRYLYCSCIT